MKDGKILGVVPKKFLPNYNEFYEKRHFTAAPEGEYDIELFGESVPFGLGLLFECRGTPELVFAAEICEDLWAAEPPSISLALGGATLIANLSASNETIGKDSYRRELVNSQSARLLCGYVYASAGSGESTQDLVFGGHDIIAENGIVLAESKLYSTGLTVTEIDVQKLASERRRNTSFVGGLRSGMRRIPFDMEIKPAELTRIVRRTPFVPNTSAETDKRCEDILTMQAHGLEKRVRHTNAKTLVIGISGGLDSTLALLVCVEAMKLLGRPASDILAVTMPCFGTTKRTRSNAERLCELLGTRLRVIDIADSVKQHFKDIGHDESNHNVVYENGQARERTKILMDLANAENGMVIGTGDLSELALGWATYNGDHMSMYGVNASVPKTLVRYIVKYYAGTVGGADLREVLMSIYDTPVSTEGSPSGCAGYSGKPGASPGGRKRRHRPDNRGSGRSVRTARFLPVQRDTLVLPAQQGFPPGGVRVRWKLRPGNYSQVAQDVLPQVLLAAVQAELPAGRRQGGFCHTLAPGRLENAQRRFRGAVAGGSQQALSLIISGGNYAGRDKKAAHTF